MEILYKGFISAGGTSIHFNSLTTLSTNNIIITIPRTLGNPSVSQSVFTIEIEFHPEWQKEVLGSIVDFDQLQFTVKSYMYLKNWDFFDGFSYGLFKV